MRRLIRTRGNAKQGCISHNAAKMADTLSRCQQTEGGQRRPVDAEIETSTKECDMLLRPMDEW